MRAWISVVAIGLVMGCGYYGDSTPGDEDRSEWRIDDGLCPGTEGGCAMTVPTALGSEVAIDANVYCAKPRRDSEGRTYSDCDLSAIDATVSGAGELREISYDAGDGRIDLVARTLEEGEVTLTLERSGELFDRSRFSVRQAQTLECGQVTDDAAWDMPWLRFADTYTFDYYGADRDTKAEVGCRLLDARGEPLFSGAAIQWEIVEGMDIANVDDGGLLGDDTANGARVYVRFQNTGTIRVQARFAELTQELELIVE